MSLQEEVIRAQVDQFERDGYLVVPDVLSSEKVDRLNAAIDEVLAEEEPSVAHNIYHLNLWSKQFKREAPMTAGAGGVNASRRGNL